ncbi:MULTISPECIES: TetR/AcrR family transcriptional regulator [Streptomyces]|uniref:TetR/AcrR family transcriptional regulator n=1 Tax=Streptomyces TaxID=1883 RepID=UPI001678D2D4|nr:MULTISPECIES: TetR/AcrR family transcriptional regulator [Streptomyces]MBK3520903.1 TetR/AcrR family transcriptional regulator [Streptomyces sp. MBT70]GGR70174.1 TetR family transcriptional regulator [Streptomyces eurythermus]
MARPRKFDETHALTAAMETFWRRGYEATSTRNLSDSTGLGQSSLYNTFGDKRELYLRALRHYYETHTAEQTALLDRPGPVKERLRDLMVHAVDTDLADPEASGCFTINASVEKADSDDEVREEVRRHFTTVERALTETIARGQRSGEISPERSAGTLARQILSTYYGLRVLARIQKDRDALLGIVESTVSAL